MSIQLNRPYKILEYRNKRYEAHYNIPSANCLIIPIKEYGDDVSCDVRWEDDNGELQLKERLFFKTENIEPLDPLKNFQLQEIWVHYYGPN